jgi:hypothetical protein
LLGVLVGLGHIFTPVAGAIVMTMLLAWKTELSRFAGGLHFNDTRTACAQTSQSMPKMLMSIDRISADAEAMSSNEAGNSKNNRSFISSP